MPHIVAESLPAHILQKDLKFATNSLNNAIQRMTKDFKINMKKEDSISIAAQNAASSLSTLSDADILQESSYCIKEQKFQQAAEKFMATVKLAPSITFSLI